MKRTYAKTPDKNRRLTRHFSLFLFFESLEVPSCLPMSHLSYRSIGRSYSFPLRASYMGTLLFSRKCSGSVPFS